jgi:CHAT domain-containing protein/tetratricopeptide (TPR) repeat protein
MGLTQWVQNLIQPELKQQKESEWELLNDRLIELHNAGSYPEAILIGERARKLAVQIWGATHANVATSCNNLAELYEKQNRLEEAEALLLKAIQIDRKALSADHPGLATDLNNLASLYQKQNRLEEAEPLFLEAIALGKKALPPHHPCLRIFFNNLAGLLAASDRPKAALKLMLRGGKIDDTNIRRYFGASSERERLAYFQSIKGNFDFFLSLVCQYLPHSAAAKQAALNLVLKRKALRANSAISAILGDRYPPLEEKLQQWRQLGDELLELSCDIPEPEEVAARRLELVRVQKERNELQRQLEVEIPEIRLQELSWDRKTVASCLPAGTTLVEFVRFDLYDFEKKRWQDARYLAFVLPAGQPSRVELADLGDAANIDKLISQFRESLTTESGLAPHLYNKEAGCQLREAVFDKLAPALGSCRNLVLVPDGDLNLAPLGILPLEDGERIWRDECAINSVSRGGELLRNRIDFGGKPGPALAVGAPNYDFGGDGDEPPPDAPFQDIPETGYLAETVAKRLGVEALLGDAALVGELLGRRSPRVLFLASSGFFFEDRQENSSIVEHLGGNLQDWMLGCGVALAGANTGSLGGELPPEAGRGVIFARDVAAWDLAATELAILVPCQREELGGEGVLGLRRAFAVAGVKSLIVSLWDVPVYGSILLMERFFDYIDDGWQPAEALEVAQDYLKNVTVGELRQSELGMKVLEELELGEEELPEMKPLEHPYYWGAWVCQGVN